MLTAFVVDDTPTNIMMFSDALEMARYYIETAEDGLEALNWLETHDAPALILLDVNLPHYDGKQIYISIRQKEKFAKTIVIIATANAYMAHQLEAIIIPTDYIMLKPVNLIELQHIAVTIRREYEQALEAAQALTTTDTDESNE